MQLVPKELRKLRCAEASQAELGACFSRIIACIMLASSGPLKRGILCMCVGEGERGGRAQLSPVSNIEARHPAILRGRGAVQFTYLSAVRAVTYQVYEQLLITYQAYEY